MIFKISWAADPSRSETVWFRSRMVPSCSINYQKFGDFMQNYNEKTDFYVQLFIGLIQSNKESPNFWHVISQLTTTLYWNQQGSAAHEIPNHWISPSLGGKLVWDSKFEVKNFVPINQVFSWPFLLVFYLLLLNHLTTRNIFFFFSFSFSLPVLLWYLLSEIRIILRKYSRGPCRSENFWTSL